MSLTTELSVPLLAMDATAFAPFGTLITGAEVPRTRRFYSEHLENRPADSAPVLHGNCVPQSTLPLRCTRIERHPFAAQCFMPLDVTRYVVLVMPSGPGGAPVLDQARAFEVPGSMGVIYKPEVWHMGATVLDQIGHFAVLMWRGGAGPDDEFREIPPIVVQP